MTRLLGIYLTLVLVGCTGARQMATLDREKPSSEREIASRRALLGTPLPMEPSPFEKFDIAVVGGSCAPKINAKFAVSACVNEQPCNGYGTRLPGGKLDCACYEVAGGCDGRSFCNHRTHQCTKLPGDTYHTP